MAWRKAGIITGLKLKIRDTYIDLGNFTGFPLVFSNELLQIANSPWEASLVWGGIYPSDDYTKISGAGAGSINFSPYLYLLSNGESIYIYSDTFGESVNIEIYRRDSSHWETFVNYYGQRSGGINTQISVETPTAGHIAWTALSFFVDDDNGLGTIVSCANATWYMSGLGDRALRAEQAGFGSNASPFTHVIYMLVAGNEIDPPISGNNPYEDGGYSDITDETGDFDETSDIIEEPNLPASLAVSSGFLTVYNPTYTQVVDLGNYVWNSLPLDTFKKMFANPMDVIIGLSIFPFLIDDDSRNWEIMIGNINSHVTARKARNQFQVVDCGKLYIKPYSKSYLDYSPYTKIELALPYIGTKQLDTDIIMGKWIWVKYRVDLISGGCMAILSFSDTENGEYSVIAEYTGKCNIEIPISGSDFRELGRGILQAVAGTGAILLSNGAVGSDWVGSGLANLVTGMKPNIERSGGLTSCIGLLGVQKPRIIKTIPRQCVPENQAQLQGYPVLIKDNFANLEGFTSFEEVSIKGARMTEREKQRAKALLESGVIK